MSNQERDISLRFMATLFELDFMASKYIDKYGEDIGEQPLESPFLAFSHAMARIEIEMGAHFVELLNKYRSSDDYYLSTLAEAILEDRLDKIKAILATLA